MDFMPTVGFELITRIYGLTMWRTVLE